MKLTEHKIYDDTNGGMQEKCIVCCISSMLRQEEQYICHGYLDDDFDAADDMQISSDEAISGMYSIWSKSIYLSALCWFPIAFAAIVSRGLYVCFLNCCPEADLNLGENLSRCCLRILRPDWER